MDIGSAKPSAAERAEIPHHLLDLCEPTQPFHAVRWAEAAAAVLADVVARARLPVIVGGTGLYFRALVRGLFEAPPSDPAIRARHEAEAAQGGIARLFARLVAVDPVAAAGILPGDLVRISRALEVHEQTGTPISELRRQARPPAPLSLFTVILDPSLDVLRPRIGRRVDLMMAAGFLGEVRRLRAAGAGDARAMQALGYAQLGRHLDGALSLEDAVADTCRATVAYARRQRTWFRKEDATVREASVVDPRAASVLIARVTAWSTLGA
jgi:tRNA dimethylallyltransferase